tara:strand:+ start:181128 stop:181310 length:183 start_codon:yes stop_codon:yes gene_type:complete
MEDAGKMKKIINSTSSITSKSNCSLNGIFAFEETISAKRALIKKRAPIIKADVNSILYIY